MHGGGGEAAAEVIRVREVAHGHDGVGDRGTDVGTHDHEDGDVDGELIGTNHGDNDGGSGRGRLDEHGGEHTNQEGRDWVVRDIEHLGRVLASEELETGAHEEREKNTQMQKKTARVRAALSFGSSLEGVSHFACLAASRALFVGQAIGDVFDPLLGSLGFLLLDEIRVGLSSEGGRKNFSAKNN